MSQIRLITTQNSSADTIRLWLERSGDSVPLDIEIYLRVTKSQSETAARPRRSSSPPTWALSFPPHHGLSTHYVIPHPTHTIATLPILPPAHTPIIIPPSSVAHDPWGVPSLPSQERLGPSSKTSMHWGHIAIYYLVEQMHRWERFVFRFDKQFTSMGALKSITGASILFTYRPFSHEAVDLRRCTDAKRVRDIERRSGILRRVALVTKRKREQLCSASAARNPNFTIHAFQMVFTNALHKPSISDSTCPPNKPPPFGQSSVYCSRQSRPGNSFSPLRRYPPCYPPVNTDIPARAQESQHWRSLFIITTGRIIDSSCCGHAELRHRSS